MKRNKASRAAAKGVREKGSKGAHMDNHLVERLVDYVEFQNLPSIVKQGKFCRILSIGVAWLGL